MPVKKGQVINPTGKGSKITQRTETQVIGVQKTV